MSRSLWTRPETHFLFLFLLCRNHTMQSPRLTTIGADAALLGQVLQAWKVLAHPFDGSRLTESERSNHEQPDAEAFDTPDADHA